MKHRTNRRNEKRIWVTVVEADMIPASGVSIFNPSLALGNKWELTLEDGRHIEYPVRYKPQSGRIRKGWYNRRSYEDALPPPKKVLVNPIGDRLSE